MSKMVSVRVPDTLYDQASAQLELLNATQSDLVKSAFEFLVCERELPQPRTRQNEPDTPRKLSVEQAAKLGSSLAACSLGVCIPSDVSFDKRALRSAKEAKYEALA